MSEVKDFLKKSKGFLDQSLQTDSPIIDEFAEVLKRENIRQVKEQLATDLAPLLQRLTHIERQQDRIIELLKSQLNLDVYEKEIMDLLKEHIEKGK